MWQWRRFALAWPGASDDARAPQPRWPRRTQSGVGRRDLRYEGRPQAYVEGEIGDGCSRLDSITQTRTANALAITATLRRQGQRCTMIMQYLNRWVPLDGSFVPGEYIVRANSAAVAFQLVAGGEGTQWRYLPRR